MRYGKGADKQSGNTRGTNGRAIRQEKVNKGLKRRWEKTRREERSGDEREARREGTEGRGRMETRKEREIYKGEKKWHIHSYLLSVSPHYHFQSSLVFF